VRRPIPPQRRSPATSTSDRSQCFSEPFAHLPSFVTISRVGEEGSAAIVGIRMFMSVRRKSRPQSPAMVKSLPSPQPDGLSIRPPRAGGRATIKRGVPHDE
jgi:hypothetical protein